MGWKRHAVTFGLGYLLADPGVRRRVDGLGRQAVEVGRPRARELREHLWDAAGGALLSARNAVGHRRRVRRVDAAAVAAFGGAVPPDHA